MIQELHSQTYSWLVNHFLPPFIVWLIVGMLNTNTKSTATSPQQGAFVSTLQKSQAQNSVIMFFFSNLEGKWLLSHFFYGKINILQIPHAWRHGTFPQTDKYLRFAMLLLPFLLPLSLSSYWENINGLLSNEKMDKLSVFLFLFFRASLAMEWPQSSVIFCWKCNLERRKYE